MSDPLTRVECTREGGGSDWPEMTCDDLQPPSSSANLISIGQVFSSANYTSTNSFDTAGEIDW